MKHYPSSLVAVLFLVLAVLLIPSPALSQVTNDECATATVVSTLPFSVSENTRLATPNASDPVFGCSEGLPGKTVWFQFTPARDTFVTFSTRNSTPADYDIVMALYTGTCGNLTEIACNDDITQGTVRQSEIPGYVVHAGVTYTILIGEWKGGGPSGGVPTGGNLVFDVTYSQHIPYVLGPKYAVIASGYLRDTAGFNNAPMAGGGTGFCHTAEHPALPLYPLPPNATKPLAPEGSNVFKDRVLAARQSAIGPPHAEVDFKGFDNNGAIPPDVIMGVGPNHIIGAVNSSFRVFDKSGNVLKTIDLDSWFNFSGLCDPQVFYDHYARRWVVVAISCGETPNHVFMSVSRDSNPLNPWYNYAFPGNGLGDSLVAGVFCDHEQIGYDSVAVYVTGRFFTAAFLHSTVWILNKEQLYANTGGPVNYSTFWDFRDPVVPVYRLDNLKPSIMFDNPGVHFLVNVSPYTTGTFVTVWTIHNPVNNPTITGADIPVTVYTPAPQPAQPGASPFESNSIFQHKAIYRDSSLWMVHSVGYGPLDTATGYDVNSGVHYVHVNPFTNKSIEDYVLGLDGHFSFYPTIMVEPNHDVIIGFNRSSLHQYGSAYFTGRRHDDPPGLSPSFPLKEGVAGYYVGTRNRWGDYNGIGLDPSDPTSVWVHTEYVAAQDVWGTWFGKLTLNPSPGVKLVFDHATRNFGSYEVGSIVSTDTELVTVANVGAAAASISSITHADPNFLLMDAPSTPFVLGPGESFTFNAAFAPQSRANNDTVVIASDDPVHPLLKFGMKGNSYIVPPPQKGVLYVTAQTPGRVYTVDQATGAATLLGMPGYDRIAGLRVRVRTNQLIGYYPPSTLVRISSTLGDAHALTTLASPPVALKAFALRNDTLYFGQGGGRIYRVGSGDSVFQVGNGGHQILGMDFNPRTGDLWFSDMSSDKIYKMTLPAGPSKLVGSTGLGLFNQDILFDAAGNLFAMIGSGLQANSLVRIDTATGAGTIIGAMGFSNGQAMGWVPDSLLGTAFLGQAPTDSSKTQPYTYFNTGSDTVNIVDAASTDPAHFTITPHAATILPSGSALFTLTFTPLTIGPKNASVRFTLAGDRRNTVLLTNGTGIRRGVVTANYDPLWNLISLPVAAGDASIATLFSSLALSNAFEYTGSGYEQRDTIVPGTGYWLKFGSAVPIGYAGTFSLTDTVAVKPGWNLIGALSHSVAPGAITGVHAHLLSPVFAYHAGYTSTDSLYPGFGYWVRTDSTGKLALLHGGGPASAPKTYAAGLKMMNVLHITDAAGITQDLYFGKKSEGMPEVSYFELPPVPPAGVFDARFASGRNLEYLESGKPVEAPVVLAGVHYPVTLSWSIRSQETACKLKIGSREIPLIENGRQVIAQADGEVTLQSTGSKLLPTVFALGQNYPNPFNPTTQIRYDLPKDVHVSLAVFDVLGRLVATLVNENQEAGFKSVEWNAANQAGLAVPSGVYFYRLQAGTFSETKKLMLLR